MQLVCLGQQVRIIKHALKFAVLQMFFSLARAGVLLSTGTWSNEYTMARTRKWHGVISLYFRGNCLSFSFLCFHECFLSFSNSKFQNLHAPDAMWRIMQWALCQHCMVRLISLFYISFHPAKAICFTFVRNDDKNLQSCLF